VNGASSLFHVVVQVERALARDLDYSYDVAEAVGYGGEDGDYDPDAHEDEQQAVTQPNSTNASTDAGAHVEVVSVL
jgi:hypothetical protein